MGLADSEGPIIWDTDIRGDSPAILLEDLDVAFTAADWVGSPITDGVLYTLESKQGLFAKAKLWNRHLPGQSELHLQFLSNDLSKEGYRHRLRCSPGWLYRVHANRCQTFIAREGELYDDCVQGGIPFVTTEIGEVDCAAKRHVTNEAWWSNDSFRHSLVADTDKWSACHNGDLMNTEVNPGWEGFYTWRATLRLLPLTICVSSSDFFARALQRCRFYTEPGHPKAPLLIDPLLVWGSGAAHDSIGYLRAQTYDSIMPTMGRPVDFEEDDVLELPWVNYMGGADGDAPLTNRLGCLYLQRAAGVGPGSSVAYAY